MINLNKHNYIKLFLILSFICCWISISTNTSDIYNIFKMYKSNNVPTFNEIINCLRQSMIFIIFPFLLILNLFKYSKDNFKNNFPFFCLLFYFFFQIPGLIFTQNSLLNIGFIISAINILLILNLANQLFNKKLLMIFIYINLFFLILIMYLNRASIVNFWYTENMSFLYTFRDRFGENFLGKIGPRSTGSARTILLIYIIAILVFKNFFNKYQNLKYFCYLITALLVLLFQSRTVIVLLSIFIIFNYLNEKKNISISKYIIIYIIVPIISLYALIYMKSNFSITLSKFQYKNKVELDLDSLNKEYARKIHKNNFSSGRTKDWKSLLDRYKKGEINAWYDNKTSFYYGFGAQGDRYLINQSASNGILYALVSSGSLGIFFYLIFILSCLVKVLDNSIVNYKKNSLENRLSSLIILLLLSRSVLETSFSVFSVDFILMCTFFIYLNKKEFLKKNAD